MNAYFYLMNPEQQRLASNAGKKVPLEQWGPYLSERQWGTVREDYSEHGDAWGYFPFEHAHCRAYRWGEDGIAGISDFFQNLCFSVALWNGKDKILKERLYGLITSTTCLLIIIWSTYTSTRKTLFLMISWLRKTEKGPGKNRNMRSSILVFLMKMLILMFMLPMRNTIQKISVYGFLLPIAVKSRQT
jgi:hypothetical protein